MWGWGSPWAACVCGAQSHEMRWRCIYLHVALRACSLVFLWAPTAPTFFFGAGGRCVRHSQCGVGCSGVVSDRGVGGGVQDYGAGRWCPRTRTWRVFVLVAVWWHCVVGVVYHGLVVRRGTCGNGLCGGRVPCVSAAVLVDVDIARPGSLAWAVYGVIAGASKLAYPGGALGHARLGTGGFLVAGVHTAVGVGVCGSRHGAPLEA